jgi:PAS domain S-box-containing protein
MMAGGEYTKEQPITELAALHQRIVVLEASNTAYAREVEALRETQRITQAIIEGTTDAIFAKDTQGRYMMVNTAFAHMVRRPMEDIVGHDDATLFPPDMARRLVEADRHILTTGETRTIEEVWTSTGTRRIYLSTKGVRRDPQGNVIGLVGTSREITERKRSREALKVQSRQQAVVVELGQRALAGAALSALMDDAVSRVAQTLDAERCKVLELLPDGHALLLRAGVGWKDGYVGSATVDAGIASQAGYTLLFDEPVVVDDLRTETRFSGPQLLHDHGVVSGMSVIIGGVERPFGILGVHTTTRRTFTEDDIHFLKAVANVLATAIERKRAEEALRFTQFAIDHSSDAAFWMESDARFIYVNDAACRSLGYTRDELLSMTVHDIDPDFPPEVWSETWRRVREGIPLTLESHHRTKDGRVFPVEISTNYLEFNGQEYNCAFARDITERKRLEEQLLQAQKMQAIGTLAGGIAHEFNNILAAILGFTDLTVYEVPSGSPVWHNLQEVLTAGRRAKDLVQQILAFSRQCEAKRIPVQLHLIVREAFTLLRASLPSTIVMRWQIERDVGTVLADPTQIQQVLMNLCANAEYAMRETGGAIEVSLDAVEVDAALVGLYPELQAGPHVLLTVHDTGQGIAPEMLGRIFEPFFTTKGVGEGTGMGLAIAHGIVASHGGTLTVESTPGQGTTFALYLPRIGEATAGEARPQEPVPQGTGRILFVDDEEVLARIGHALLVHLGYDVVACTSSREALETFQATPQHFDLVLTDQTMPEMTGEVLARELRRIRPDIPIILCTGFSHVMNAEKAHALGIDAFLMKPLVTQELAQVIRRLVGQQTTSES